MFQQTHKKLSDNLGKIPLKTKTAKCYTVNNASLLLWLQYVLQVHFSFYCERNCGKMVLSAYGIPVKRDDFTKIL